MATKKNKGCGKNPKKAVKLQFDENNVRDAVFKIVNGQLGNLLNTVDESDSDSESEMSTENVREPSSKTHSQQQPKTYKSQVVILDGVSDSLKNIRLDYHEP